MLCASGIKKSYDKKVVLSGADIKIARGSIVGLYGESGSGKSTLAKILCGLLRADGGSAELNGAVLFSPEKRYDRKLGLKIQTVYQQPFAVLDPSQRIINGICEFMLYHKIASRENVPAAIDAFLSVAAIERDILNHYPHQISGGEAQRIAIGKSLLIKPELLILDEATSMLDVSTQANILSMIKREMSKIGGSVLMISHDKQLVDFFCGEVYDVRDGKTISRGKNEKN